MVWSSQSKAFDRRETTRTPEAPNEETVVNDYGEHLAPAASPAAAAVVPDHHQLRELGPMRCCRQSAARDSPTDSLAAKPIACFGFGGLIHRAIHYVSGPTALGFFHARGTMRGTRYRRRCRKPAGQDVPVLVVTDRKRGERDSIGHGRSEPDAGTNAGSRAVLTPPVNPRRVW
jgi:hypothetical protein